MEEARFHSLLFDLNFLVAKFNFYSFFMKEVIKSIVIDGKAIQMSCGKIANLAQGAVFLQMGGTTVLATATYESKDSDLDFFPLSVEYIEKMYASGTIGGGKYQKREGFPSDDAIIKARQVDHSIRSLFPKTFRRPVAVIITVLSFDGVNDPEALAVLGASAALMRTGVPYMGPCSSVIVSLDENDNLILNPDLHQRHHGRADFLISGVTGRVLNIEGWAKEISEELMDKIIDAGMEYIAKLNNLQHEFIKEAGQNKFESEIEYTDVPLEDSIIEKIEKDKYDDIKKVLFTEKTVDFSRESGFSKIVDSLLESYSKESSEDEIPSHKLRDAVEYIAKKILRQLALEEDKRISNRGLREIRPLSADIDLLPVVHGSALFTRGLTQSLSIVTLGPIGDAQLVESMEGEQVKPFMHHYNMAAYTTGEVGKYNYKPGRREVGHGAIGENALKNVMPSQEEFPYTVRVVSEIMTSNGSTSMAATCSSSMALMAAGVPIKKQIAGIGVGLITSDDTQENYKLLLDIEGIEDFYGDMDFKVCGSADGITAIQYENKVRGVKPEIIKEAIRLARTGRMQVLEVMNKVISAPRNSVSENAPVVESITIDQNNIGELIGPGGKNIKALVEEATRVGNFQPDINIDDSGKVLITAKNKHQGEYIKNRILGMFKKAEVGEIYDGVVDKVMDYGAFVNVTPNITGLLHASEMGDEFVKDATNVFSEGDQLKVKVIKTEFGKTSFSLKGVEQSQETMNKIKEGARKDKKLSFRQEGGFRRGNDRGRDRNRRF